LHVGEEGGEIWSEPEFDGGMVLCVDLFVGTGHIEGRQLSGWAKHGFVAEVFK
jgi:hypothetical protein